MNYYNWERMEFYFRNNKNKNEFSDWIIIEELKKYIYELRSRDIEFDVVIKLKNADQDKGRTSENK